VQLVFIYIYIAGLFVTNKRRTSVVTEDDGGIRNTPASYSGLL